MSIKSFNNKWKAWTSILTPREKQILEMRYGIYTDEPKTLEEVGKEFNVSRERIRQIEKKALEKIDALEKDLTKNNEGV